MGALIQVRARFGPGAAQPSITPAKSRLHTTVKRVVRTVRARREGIWKVSSGMMPRFSGSIQKSAGSSAFSAIGKMPHA